MPAPEPESLLGRRLGAYHIVKLIGRGGMADIYAARHVGTHGSRSRVAIKRILPSLMDDTRHVELFLHEAEITGRLSHPNLVRCIDFETIDDVPFMVLEYVDGVPLDLLLRWMAGREAFPAPLALAIVRALLRGLGFAHAARDSLGRPLGVVHQDVSPDNVLIARTGEIKLTDFGISKSVLLPQRADPKELRGKMGYMPPEQIIGHETGPRSDLFSVGVVLAELLRGSRLFAASDALPLLLKTYQTESGWLREIESVVPSVVAGLVRTALAREPAQRFRSAGAFERAVCLAAQSLGTPADGGDVVAWLARRGMMPRASGVRLAFGRGAKAQGFTGKLDVARRSVESLRGEATRDSPSSPRASPSSPFAGDDVFRIQSSHGSPQTHSLAELLAMIATGGLDRDTLVASTHGPFVRSGEVAPLAFLLRLPAFRFDEARRPTDWQAPLVRAEVPSLLFALARARARGVLEARSGSRIKRVFFDEGAPIFVASTDPAELLGRKLAASGLLDSAAVEANVELATRQGRHLADALVGRKLVPPGAMLRLLVAQLEDRVMELAAWADGEVVFRRGARPGVAVPGPLGPPATLACKLVRTQYSNEELTRFVERVLDAPLAASPPAHRANSYALDEMETILVHRARGAARARDTLDALADKDVPIEHARRALFLLLSAGALRSPAWPLPTLPG